LAEQQSQQYGWTGDDVRPVEVVRGSVFTSVKKDTRKWSTRIQMYERMKEANYDVYIMETVGDGEKCVDIQLAVEMLHYATVPNSYDVAILLSGDKDFLPALVRTRQKARKVGLVSMRTACNRALYETPNVLDYDVIWIEDYLDRLFVPKKGVEKMEGHVVSAFTLEKVIYDFIDKSGLESVNSRDIGRYLKNLEVGKTQMLSQVKMCYDGLFNFLKSCGCFEIARRSASVEKAVAKFAPDDKSFWVSIKPYAELKLVQEAKRTHFTSEEKAFFDSYSLEKLEGETNRPKMYSSSLKNPLERDGLYGGIRSGWVNGADGVLTELELPESLTKDYSICTVVQLKEICRERGLPVSGTKAVLLQRIQADVDHEIEIRKRKKHEELMPAANGDNFISGENTSDTPETHFFQVMIKEYLRASGGEASSRDIGRYLAANSGYGGTKISALSQLKEHFGSLASFLMANQQHFYRTNQEGGDAYEFRVGLR
jgi:hypothetical protein